MNHDHDRIDALEQRMSAIEHAVPNLQSELASNTEVTLRIECNTKELVELLKLAKTGVSFFAGVGRALRKLAIWFGPFIAIASLLWAMAHGKLPGGHP
jgi:hypothetical protein